MPPGCLDRTKLGVIVLNGCSRASRNRNPRRQMANRRDRFPLVARPDKYDATEGAHPRDSDGPLHAPLWRGCGLVRTFEGLEAPRRRNVRVIALPSEDRGPASAWTPRAP